MLDTTKERTALVLCDLQPDQLKGLKERGDSLLLSLRIPLEAARKNNWLVAYSGLQFKSGYDGVSPNHKLYGALRKLNARLGDKAVHWFMEGWDGSQIISDPIVCPKDIDKVVWRSQHIPHELAELLKEEGISKVFVAGTKASGSVQITCQLLMDNGMEVTAIKECIQDDNEERLNAAIEHLLPIYANVISLEEMMDTVGGLESYSAESKDILVYHILSKGDENNDGSMLLCNCQRKGHGARYIQLLLERGGWKSYPTQVWYEDFIDQFHCPLFKRLVDFCDEPEFSKTAMYLAGREHLDEKDKVIAFCGQFMPKTYCINNGKWIGDEPPTDDEEGALDAPWFIKKADMNLGGAAIDIVSKPSEIMAHINKDQRYVVQQHIKDPLLTDDGRKTHLKFYVLLICDDDGETWTLYTYKGALLSISPNVWSPSDLSHDTQVTIHRHPEHPGQTEGWKQHWENTYEKCKQGTTEVIEKAIASGKLKGRHNKKQFEVFSVDWMPDKLGNIWMFEFNLSPAIGNYSDEQDERRGYLMQHDKIMMREALAIVMPWAGGQTPGLWDLAGEFKSRM